MESLSPKTRHMLNIAFWKACGIRLSEPRIQGAIDEHRCRVYLPFETPEFEDSPQVLLHRIGLHQAQVLFLLLPGDLRRVLAEAEKLPAI